jgi:hypothetical protein
MRLIPMRLIIVNLSLALTSASIWAQDNPISAIFGAAKQMMPSSNYNKNTRLTRHQNPRQINNRILGQVNRTAGRLVKAALYTPIETMQMIGNNIVNAKNNRAGRRYYQAQNQFDPTARQPVLANNRPRRSETYTGQDISALGKKNHLLKKVLPKTKQHHLDSKQVKHKVDVLKTNKHHQKHHTMVISKKINKPQPNDNPIQQNATTQTKNLKPTVSTDSQNTPKMSQSPASLEHMVPVNYSNSTQSKPNSNQHSTSDLLISGTIINPPNNVQKTSSTVPYQPSENVLTQTTNSDGSPSVQNPQIDAPIKPYEICPKPNINQN